MWLFLNVILLNIVGIIMLLKSMYDDGEDVTVGHLATIVTFGIFFGIIYIVLVLPTYPIWKKVAIKGKKKD